MFEKELPHPIASLVFSCDDLKNNDILSRELGIRYALTTERRSNTTLIHREDARDCQRHFVAEWQRNKWRRDELRFPVFNGHQLSGKGELVQVKKVLKKSFAFHGS